MERTGGKCSITVHLKQTEQVSGGGVLLEACRVGRVNESDGSMILNWDLGELTSLRPSVSTEHVTGILSEMIYGGTKYVEGETGIVSMQDVEVHDALTSEDGTCTFSGLEEGAWLIHAVDSSSYGIIEDTLVAVPCYVQEGTKWTGPVYDPDIWIKGEITKAVVVESETEVRQTEKQEPETTAPQTEKRVPQTEKPSPQAPAKDTGKGTPATKAPSTEKTETVTVIEKTKNTETEHPVTGKPVPKAPESEKKTRTNVPRTTAQSTQVVRTLDDTPLAGLVTAFLGCAVVIVIILTRLRRRGRMNRDSIRTGSGGGSGTRSGRKRRGRRMLLLAVGAGMTLLPCLSVRAADSEEDFAKLVEGERKILFVNESPSAPCLTVGKEVLNAEDGSRAPSGDVFTFRLTLDLERASGVKYRLFDESGTELLDLTGDGENLVPAGNAAGDPVPFRTGRDGSFTLHAGQYALFEDVSVGELWEVEETVSGHYERVVPGSSGSLSGTIERNGNTAQFVNRYLPKEDPGLTEGILEITKQILWPEGCALPDRGSFQIRVLVDGAAWKDAPVELRDRKEGALPAQTRTDENGIFVIRGDQKATIRSIPAGSDLYVEEIDDSSDLFVPSGDLVWRGASSSRSRVTFTNRLADFTVEKTLLSGDMDHRFLFCLLDRDGRPLSGIPYYLVNGNGSLEGTDPEYTDAQGHFTLKSGERAVFAGMEEGDRYSVIEETVLGYRQVTPEGREGYSGLRVQGGIPSLLFENEPADASLFVPATGGPGIMLVVAGAMALLCTSLVIFRLWSGRKSTRNM